MVLCTWDSDRVHVLIKISLMSSVTYLVIAPAHELGGDGEQWWCLAASNMYGAFPAACVC